MRNILVTGCAGFIGSNFLDYFMDKYPEYNFIHVDKLTYAAEYKNNAYVFDRDNYTFYKDDICDVVKMNHIFEYYDITDVIHFAAESHVDHSIKYPTIFTKTNIIGTQVLLDAARNSEMSGRFHFISTDEVYGSIDEGLFTEESKFSPNSPYAVSKASADMMVQAYHETYKMNTTISSCSNCYGPRQDDTKLIPKIIDKLYNGQKVPIYGDGSNIRDWLYVLDHCKAIDRIFHEGINGERYNVGGRNEKTNLYIVKAICDIMNINYDNTIEYVEDRAGHDKRYAIDATKLETKLGWIADETFDTGIVKTVEWYVNQHNIGFK